MVITIQDIPDEILIEILSQLPKKDLKTARLVCTLWSTAGAKWMFQRVYFAPRKASMETFANIAANPTFARNVKELIYDGRLFLPELGTFASYYSAFHARMVDEFDFYEGHDDVNCFHELYRGSIWNMEDLGAGERMKRWIAGDFKDLYANVADSLVRYARLLEQQESIFTKGRDLKALCQGLKSFRNITKVSALVEFDHYSDYHPHTEDRDDHYIVPHQWYSYRSYLEFGLTVPPSKWCRRSQNLDGEQLDQEEHIKWDVRGVQNLFRAISTRCPSLKELRIGSMQYKAPMTIFQLSDTYTKKVRTMARRLRTLRLYPYVTKSDDPSEYAKQHYCLGLLLREAKELRKLSSSRWALDYNESAESDDEDEQLASNKDTDFGLFLGKHWPQLTELTLRDACMKAEDLMSILRVHRGSLRDLCLECISLHGKGRWEHVGKEIGQTLKLHIVCVRGLFDDDIGVLYESRWSPQGKKDLALAQDMVQWAPPEMLDIQKRSCMVTARITAGL